MGNCCIKPRPSHAHAESVQITFNPWGADGVVPGSAFVDRPAPTSDGFVGHLDSATFEAIFAAARPVFEYTFMGRGPAGGCCCVTAVAGAYCCWNPKAVKGAQFVKEMASTYPTLDFVYESEYVCHGEVGCWLHYLIIKPKSGTGVAVTGQPADVVAQQTQERVKQPEATHTQVPPWGEEGVTEWSMAPHEPWASAVCTLELGWVQRHSSFLGFRRGKKLLGVLRRDACHNKHAFFQLLRQQGLNHPVAKFYPPTYLSLEEFHAREPANSVQPARADRPSAHNEDLYFLKLADVDEGTVNGSVRAFRGTIAFAELAELARAMTLSLGNQSRELVVQQAPPHMLLSPRLHKLDLRVYACCDATPEHNLFIHRRLDLREAKRPYDNTDLEGDVQLTHVLSAVDMVAWDDWPYYAEAFPRLCEAVRCVLGVLRSTWEPVAGEESILLSGFYAFDFLLDADLRPHLLQLNQVPALEPGVSDVIGREYLELVVRPALEDRAPELGNWIALEA